VAGGPGFEPRLTESESAVLPLNYPPPRKPTLNSWNDFICRDGQPAGLYAVFNPAQVSFSLQTLPWAFKSKMAFVGSLPKTVFIKAAAPAYEAARAPSAGPYRYHLKSGCRHSQNTPSTAACSLNPCGVWEVLISGSMGPAIYRSCEQERLRFKPALASFFQSSRHSRQTGLVPLPVPRAWRGPPE
jgi:hypothetical protein